MSEDQPTMAPGLIQAFNPENLKNQRTVEEEAKVKMTQS